MPCVCVGGVSSEARTEESARSPEIATIIGCELSIGGCWDQAGTWETAQSVCGGVWGGGEPMYACTRACGIVKPGVLDSLELEFTHLNGQTWVLGTTGSSAKAAHSLILAI